MSGLAEFHQRDRDRHPPAFSAGYKTSVTRSPRLPLISLEQTASEITGPTFGHNELGPLDHDLIKNYARQETVDPLTGAGRWVGLGLAGSVLLMIGGIALTLAMLRALQEETGTAFTGNLSWAPYLLTLFAVLVVIIVLALRINKKTL